MATYVVINILVKGIDFMNKKNFINITAEALTDDTMKANYTGNVRNLNQLISLGGALLQTYICSAVEIIKQNTDENIPDEIIQLTIMDALIDKIGNLLNMEDVQDKEDAVDSFLDNIINGKHKN